MLITSLFDQMSDAAIAATTNYPDYFRQLIERQVESMPETGYFTPLWHTDARHTLETRTDHPTNVIEQIMAGHSKAGKFVGEPFAWLVKKGYTLDISNIRLERPIIVGNGDLPRASWREEVPDRDLLVFFRPFYLDSVREHEEELQARRLAKLRADLELPEHHFCRFGHVSLVAGLLLAHKHAAGMWLLQQDGLLVRTDSFATTYRKEEPAVVGNAGKKPFVSGLYLRDHKPETTCLALGIEQLKEC